MKKSKQSKVFPNFNKIAINPKICTGKPHILGTRITVSSILAALAGGASIDKLLEYYPSLHKDEILQALSFASEQAQEEFHPFESAA